MCVCVYALRHTHIRTYVQHTVPDSGKKNYRVVEAEKGSKSSRGWAGVILNTVIKLTAIFKQSPEEVRQ